jgi:hypothetical protein
MLRNFLQGSALNLIRSAADRFIVDGITHKHLTPQQIVDAYNFIALELAKQIQSDVD